MLYESNDVLYHIRCGCNDIIYDMLWGGGDRVYDILYRYIKIDGEENVTASIQYNVHVTPRNPTQRWIETDDTHKIILI